MKIRCRHSLYLPCYKQPYQKITLLVVSRLANITQNLCSKKRLANRLAYIVKVYLPTYRKEWRWQKDLKILPTPANDLKFSLCKNSHSKSNWMNLSIVIVQLSEYFDLARLWPSWVLSLPGTGALSGHT